MRPRRCVDSTARDTLTLPPVVVTAARHAEDLFAVPLAVTTVPELTYAASVSYRPAPFRPAQLRLGVQGASAYFADDANQVQVPSYRIVSATLGLAQPIALGGGVALRAFLTVNNLFDRRYVASAFLNPDVVDGEPIAFDPGLPRNYVVGLTLERRP